MIGSILWGLFAGLLRALFAPIAQWLHDRQVRAEALSDVKRHEAEALQAAVREAKHATETIDRESRADTDAALDELHRLRHPEAYRQ